MFVLAVTFGHLERVVFIVLLFEIQVTCANGFTNCGTFGGLK